MAKRHAHAGWCWDIFASERGGAAARLDGIGWGAFFIWIGVALLFDVGWGPTLLGIGLITLGVQAARWLFGLRLEGFWLLVGVAFLVGGVWQLVDTAVPLLPVLLMLAGLALVAAALLPRRARP